MPPKTAKRLIEDQVQEYRKELLRDVSKRSELRALGYESYEIDEMIREETDELEKDVVEYRRELLAELPQREAAIAEARSFIFAKVAFDEVWLRHCLTPVEEEASSLVTKEVYENYLSWCGEVGIVEPYSLAKVRTALKNHYGIDNIRTGLRLYRLVEVPTRINREQVIAQYEAAEEKREREVARLQDLTCRFCERRKYDGNRFDRCYWCNRLSKVGFQVALSEYLSEDVPWERTGNSMHLAYQRMLAAGEILDTVYRPPTATPLKAQNEPSIPPIEYGNSRTGRGSRGFWGILKEMIGL